VRSNLWSEHAAALADAYARDTSVVRFELVTRALLLHLPAEPQRVIDVGGGFGRQAILLARMGHSVAILDFDPHMLAIARDQLSAEPPDVRSRIDLLLGDGNHAKSLVDEEFDLACSHSVLMYEDDPAPMLREIVKLVRPGGLISVLCVNKEASAMRAGLQGHWDEAVASLATGVPVGDRYVPTREWTRDEVVAILASAGAIPKAWYGVGVFTDHISGKLVVDEVETVLHAEWLAGSRDPYRRVARCFHLVAERAQVPRLRNTIS
jgi:SAM-dependent methyltransferase